MPVDQRRHLLHRIFESVRIPIPIIHQARQDRRYLVTSDTLVFLQVVVAPIDTFKLMEYLQCRMRQEPISVRLLVSQHFLAKCEFKPANQIAKRSGQQLIFLHRFHEEVDGIE